VVAEGRAGPLQLVDERDQVLHGREIWPDPIARRGGGRDRGGEEETRGWEMRRRRLPSRVRRSGSSWSCMVVWSGGAWDVCA
jgi:hypothetical protein